MFYLQQNQRKRGNSFCPEAGGRGVWGKVAQVMYTYISKSKNNKIKFKK
jgi:hypothetical protein